MDYWTEIAFERTCITWFEADGKHFPVALSNGDTDYEDYQEVVEYAENQRWLENHLQMLDTLDEGEVQYNP